MKGISLEMAEAKHRTESEILSFAERVTANQRYLAAHLRKVYDFIVCGSGSSGSVVARRLAEIPRGHKHDWDFFAQEAKDLSWNYESVLKIYRRIEDWQGGPDPMYRGVGGPAFVRPAPDPNPIGPALLEGARLAEIPTFDSPNDRMMEAAAQFHPTAGSWILWPGLVRPLSRGYLRLTGPQPHARLRDTREYAGSIQTISKPSLDA